MKKPNIIVDEETPEDTRVVIRTDRRHTGLKRVQIDVGKHVRVFVSIYSTDSPTKGSSDDIIDPTEIATDNDTTVDVLQVTAIPEIASPRPRPLTPYQLRHIHTLSLPPLPPGPIQLPTPVEDELESEKESDPESDSSDGEMDTDSDTSFWETSARSQPTNITRGSETDSEEGQQPGDDMSKQPSSPLSLASDLPLIKDLIEPVPAPSLAAIQQAAFQLQHPQHPVTLIHAAGNHHEPPYLTFAIHTREPDNFGHVDAMTVHKRRHRMNVDAAGEVLSRGRAGYVFTSFHAQAIHSGTNPVYSTSIFDGPYDQHSLTYSEDMRFMHPDSKDYGPPIHDFPLRQLSGHVVTALFDVEGLIPPVVPLRASHLPIDQALAKRIEDYAHTYNGYKAEQFFNDWPGYRYLDEEAQKTPRYYDPIMTFPLSRASYVGLPFSQHPRPHIQSLSTHIPALTTERFITGKHQFTFIDPTFDPRRLFLSNVFVQNSSILSKLRGARNAITYSIGCLTEFLMLTSARHLIDERPEEDPTRHYFYHHCSMIRFLDETKGDLE